MICLYLGSRISYRKVIVLQTKLWITHSHCPQIFPVFNCEASPKLNEGKCDYMVFSRWKVPFNTRLTLNNQKLDKVSATKIMGIWITDDLSWEKNTKAKSYARMSMLTKLRYVGVMTEDLVEIYILFQWVLTQFKLTWFYIIF